MSSSPTSAGVLRRLVPDQVGKLRRARVVIHGDPVHQVWNVARIGQTVGQRGLVDQESGAAIGQHIGNFRLLLPGAEQNRYGAEFRRAEHRQHELDAVAEQQRDAVAALQAHLRITPLRLAPIVARPHARSSGVRRRPAPRHRDFLQPQPRSSPRCFSAARKTPAPRGRRSAPQAAWREWNSATSPC